MPRTDWGWQVTGEELRSWIVHESDSLLVVNKPAHVVCHPSKHGPWSSLIGACRQVFGEPLHMMTRLDRETSGVVVLTRKPSTNRRLHRAPVDKEYEAILCGSLANAVVVDQPIGMAPAALVASRRAVAPCGSGQPAQTEFVPLRASAGYTLARVIPRSGRTHQIRVHAAWLGHSVAGDKIYGADERLFLEFVEHGWTPRHQQLLGFERQALHARLWRCGELAFEAPPPDDWLGMLRAAHLL